MTAAALADRTISGTGTPEAAWRHWPGWQLAASTSLAELVSPQQRLVVLAPHPDDEVLGAGGLIRLATAAGRQVRIISVTDGEASHPSSPDWPIDRLRRARRTERAEALSLLGVPATAVTELHLPDGTVSASPATLAEQLIDLIEATDLVVSPWCYDGHPDHEATAVAAAWAVQARSARHLQVPIWGWHWARPDRDELPVAGAVLLELDENALIAKRNAVARFRSQLQPDSSTGAEPILPDWALQRLLRRHEVLFG